MTWDGVLALAPCLVPSAAHGAVLYLMCFVEDGRCPRIGVVWCGVVWCGVVWCGVAQTKCWQAVLLAQHNLFAQDYEHVSAA